MARPGWGASCSCISPHIVTTFTLMAFTAGVIFPAAASCCWRANFILCWVFFIGLVIFNSEVNPNLYATCDTAEKLTVFSGWARVGNEEHAINGFPVGLSPNMFYEICFGLLYCEIGSFSICVCVLPLRCMWKYVSAPLFESAWVPENFYVQKCAPEKSLHILGCVRALQQ